MKSPSLSPIADINLDRREFVKAFGVGAVTASGLVLGVPSFGQEKPPEIETNIADFLRVPRTAGSIPGPFPGRVVKVTDPRVVNDVKVDAKLVAEMFEKGIRTLTGKSMKKSFAMFFNKNDIVGLKVNPVGTPLIHTKPELVEAVVRWLTDSGLAKSNIVIWDRFEGMLKDAGYTKDRFPGVRIEGLQMMDEEGNTWKTPDGKHVSEGSFDKDVFYFAKGVLGTSVRGYKDDEFYLNQHVFAGEHSYFGRLITKGLSKIINLAAYKNTGNGISMATKNLGYAAICNTGRLHQPLFFKVCTEVLAAPALRDKLVLNITDGLIGQYEGGPDKNEKFIYPNASLYFATDPFALDLICHNELIAKRKSSGITVNEHPRFSEYLHYAQKLGLGIAEFAKITMIKVEVAKS